jgi:putative intracellular protease/amidase
VAPTAFERRQSPKDGRSPAARCALPRARRQDARIQRVSAADATTIAILLFDGVTALDVVGPYEVLTRVPHAEVQLLAPDLGTVRDGVGALSWWPDRALDALPDPDVIVVPGGPGVEAASARPEIIDWLRQASAGARWTTSVCTGALLLGAAGLLRRRRATTHWLSLERLTAYGANPQERRVVVDGPIMTAAGVSAGIDMALRLAAELAGPAVAQAIQLSLEYAPEPPFRTGSPRTAPEEIVARVRTLAHGR